MQQQMYGGGAAAIPQQVRAGGGGGSWMELLSAAGQATVIFEGRNAHFPPTFPRRHMAFRKLRRRQCTAAPPQQHGSTVPSGSGTVGDGSASASAAGLPQVGGEAMPHIANLLTLPEAPPLPPRCLSLDARPQANLPLSCTCPS